MDTAYLCYTALLLIIARGYTSQSTTTSGLSGFCGSPPSVSYGNVDVTGQYNGSVANYTCRVGYRPSTNMLRTCINGNWTYAGSRPSCIVQYCSPIPRVLYARRSPSWTYRIRVGQTATYRCNYGYRMNSTTGSTIECQANRTFTSPLPVCQPVDCGEPDVVENANSSYSSTTYGTYVTYSCLIGYSLDRGSYSARRTNKYRVRCSSNGRWATSPKCKPKDCGTPPTIQNGHRFYTSTLYGSSVLYECKLGFMIRGNATITCPGRGSWPSAPLCNPVKCSNPPVVGNATMGGLKSAFFNGKAKYKCRVGHYMDGHDTVTCQTDGSWSDPPTCHIMDCKKPPSIHHGYYKGEATTYGSQIAYFCESGYNLVGLSTIDCLRNGEWSSIPSCDMPPGSSMGSSAALAGMAITTALLVLLMGLVGTFFYYKIYRKRTQMFGYASYKNESDGSSVKI